MHHKPRVTTAQNPESYVRVPTGHVCETARAMCVVDHAVALCQFELRSQSGRLSASGLIRNRTKGRVVELSMMNFATPRCLH